ncbi:MAG: polysaccharide deacetylase family protein [bacterium]
MRRPLTIVTYHYVRDLEHSRYPNIRGLAAADFARQVSYLKRHYTIIGGHDLITAVTDGVALPANALLLTFDDGYADHYTEVFPVLDREGISGCFFPPARCVVDHVVLDVNKIHFVLACTPDARLLVEYVSAQIAQNESRLGLETAGEYWNRLAVADRYDSAEIVFVKRMLQRELPLELRASIIDELFRRYVSTDEASFARELYMTADQLRVLCRHGMYVGSHGYDHFWLNRLSRTDQEAEIDRSLTFLSSVGAGVGPWIMCYPYGAYNDTLLEVLRSRNCAVALTTEVDIADLAMHSPLTLPRLDTNDFPKIADAEPSTWTMKIGG